MLFGVIGGYLLDESNPTFVFFVTAALGLLILVNAVTWGSDLEHGASDIIQMTFTQRSRLTFGEVWRSIKLRPMRNLCTFFIIYGTLLPSFSNYFYYFLTDELGFTQI